MLGKLAAKRKLTFQGAMSAKPLAIARQHEVNRVLSRILRDLGKGYRKDFTSYWCRRRRAIRRCSTAYSQRARS